MNYNPHGNNQLVEIDSRHQCLIYEGSPSQQLPALAAMIQRKLDEGHRCLYLNSSPMVAGLRASLAAMGIDVVNEVTKSRLVLSSESITSGDGEFDIDLMLQHLEGTLDQALNDGYKGLFATGDMTWEFGSETNFAKLMEYEFKLEKLFRKRSALCGICQYHIDTLPHEAPRQGLLSHRTLFINETLSRINPLYYHMATNPEVDEMIAELCQLQNTESKLK